VIIVGLGLDVLVEMIRCMNPTHVLKSYHSKARKNVPDGAFWLASGEKSRAEIIDIGFVQTYTRHVSPLILVC
jgi:polynucleotide 5'-hydroxyl-kinase GRC3/NOL9